MFNFFKKNQHSEDLKQIKSFLRAHLNQLIDAKAKVPQDIFDVTKFFLEENLDFYESMDILIQKNHFRGCIPIARSIFENSINLQYIYKQDTEQRAKNFKLASMSAFLKRWQSMKEYTPEAEEMKAFMENEIKNYVPDNKTLKQKADEVGVQSSYKDVYKRLSEYVHSGYKSKRDFDDGRPYTIYLKRIVFSDTLIVTLEALKKVCEMYDLDGGVMVIDDPGYKGVLLYATNPKREEEKMKSAQK